MPPLHFGRVAFLRSTMLSPGSARAASATPLVLLLALCLTIAVYYPGLDGGFVFDDHPNIVDNTLLHVEAPTLEGVRQATFSVDAGPLKRPVSMLTFWVNYYFTGLDPLPFKVTNLLIHLLNGVGLFWLTTLLLDALRQQGTVRIDERERDHLALAVSAIWLVHPLNVTSVLYVVQRMTSLSASFVILGLVCHMLGRRRMARGEAGFPMIFLGLLGFGSLATLSKESGALLPLYMAAIEAALLRFSGVPSRVATKLKAFFAVTVVVPAAAVVTFLLLEPQWITGGYGLRGFTLAERLMTEARALWIYLRWIALPVPSGLGLFHDDVPLSRGMLDPVTTALAVVAHALLIGAALHLRKRAPLLTFATFWYYAGHLLESSVIPLDLIYEHRNYVPMFGPLLAGVYALYRAAARVRARAAIPAAFALALAGGTISRSLDWSSLHTLRLAVARDHPQSPIANYEAGIELANLYVSAPETFPDHYDAARQYFERASALDPINVHGLFNTILLDAVKGRPIEQSLLDEMVHRLSSLAFTPKHLESFRALLRWTTKRLVVLPRTTVTTLFEAALDNPSAGHRDRGALLSLLSAYYYNVEGDAQAAAGLALAAVEANPNEPALHLALADLATQLGNFELAAEQLDLVRRNDRLGRYALQTRVLADALEEARAKT